MHLCVHYMHVLFSLYNDLYESEVNHIVLLAKHIVSNIVLDWVVGVLYYCWIENTRVRNDRLNKLFQTCTNIRPPVSDFVECNKKLIPDVKMWTTHRYVETIVKINLETYYFNRDGQIMQILYLLNACVIEGASVTL